MSNIGLKNYINSRYKMIFLNWGCRIIEKMAVPPDHAFLLHSLTYHAPPQLGWWVQIGLRITEDAMILQREALKGAVENLIRMMDQNIMVDETMADASALVDEDFSSADQPNIAEFLCEIFRQHQIKALHMKAQQATLRSKYGFLL